MLLTVVSCTDNNKGGDTTTVPTSGSTGDDTGEKTWKPGIPNNLLTDEEGNKLEVVLRSRVQNPNAGSFDAKRDGDVVHNAVYDRNKELSDWLGCAIRVEEFVGDTNDETMYEEIQGLAQTPMYHIITTATYKMVRLAVEGMLHDLACQQYIDLTMDYYDDGYNAALNAGGRQYLAAGKLSLSWYRYQIVTIFNRNLFKEYNVEYPYEIVLNREWTVAKMSEYANEFYDDLNGDGLYDEEDQYGYYLFVGSGSSQTDGFMGAFNLRMLTKTADGYYVAREFDSTPWVTAMTAFLDMLDSDGCFASKTFAAGHGNTAIEKKFSNQETAMITYRMYVVESDAYVALSRDKEGYGILPLPMADKDQEDYVSFVQDQVLSFGIPNSMVGQDLITATAFLEAFAWVSYTTTVPAYYEKALTKKYVIDEKSKGMLAIVDSNIIVDPVNVYYGSYFNFTTGTMRAVYSKDNDISTLISSVILEGQFDAKVDKLNGMLQTLDQRLTDDGFPNSGIIITETK